MRAFEQRKPNNPDSSSFFGPKIQKKLKTGTVGDKYEVEADHVADKVVNNNSSGGGLLQSKQEVQQKPISETITSVQAKDMKEEDSVQKKSDKKEEEKPVQKKEKEEEKPVQKKEEPIQAKCADCEKEDKVQKKDKEEEKTVQKKEKNTESEIQNNELEGKLVSSRGSGTGLDKKTKGEMESGFGADFSNVKIHTDSNAVNMSQELGAQAFTNGNDVYFNDGKYNPDSKEGKHLLAHELTHTVQQTGMVQKSDTIQKSINHNEDLRAERPDNPQFKDNTPLEKANDNEMLITSGHKGGYVAEIQTGLLEWRNDSLPNFGADGDFGSETRNAVLDFQNKNNLNKIDGIVGPETMGTLDNVVLEKKGGKKKSEVCTDPDARNLPQMINPINIHDSVLSSGSEFLSKGSFKITSNAHWTKEHPVGHYNITVIEFISGSMKANKIKRRFNIGESETQTFTFPKDKCVSFKVLVEVINPTDTSPKLVGNFSVFR